MTGENIYLIKNPRRAEQAFAWKNSGTYVVSFVVDGWEQVTGENFPDLECAQGFLSDLDSWEQGDPPVQVPAGACVIPWYLTNPEGTLPPGILPFSPEPQA